MKYDMTNLKEKYYIIVPLLCFVFWALLSLIKDNFIIQAADYPAFYYSGKYIFTDPELVYSDSINPRYRYLPSFATIFSIMTIIPYEISAWVMFFLLLFFELLSILVFNRILILRGVENRFTRFLFLLVISNGLKIMQTFDILQTKVIGLFILLFFLMREIKNTKIEANEINTAKFYFIQFSLLVFVIGMMPFFFFLLIIYLFHNLQYRNIFDKLQVKKYLIVIVVFLYQNFMFFVSPVLISGFLEGSSNAFRTVFESYTPLEILQDQIILPIDSLSNFIYAFNISLSPSIIFGLVIASFILLTTILIFHKNLSIEKKFGYFTLYTLFFNLYPRPNTMVVFVPLIALVYIRNIEMKSSMFNVIKSNYLLLIGLVCLSLLYFMPPLYYIYEVVPFLMNIPLPLLLLRWTYLYVLIAITLFFLCKKDKKELVKLNSYKEVKDFKG